VAQTLREASFQVGVNSVRNGGIGRSIGAVLAAALVMSWPALYNGYPLLPCPPRRHLRP